MVHPRARCRFFRADSIDVLRRPLWMDHVAPQAGWRERDRAALAHLSVPVGFDTDVNGAALAEAAGAPRKRSRTSLRNGRTGVGVGLLRTVLWYMVFCIPSSGTFESPPGGDTWPVCAVFMAIVWEGSRPDGPSPPARAPRASRAPTRAVEDTVFITRSAVCHGWSGDRARRIIIGRRVMEARPELPRRLARSVEACRST